MGNYMSGTNTCLPVPSGKVILWDGSVQEFNWPLEAAELMVEHPGQVVVEFNAAINQKRPVPLPADHKLDVNKLYLMLPVKRGKPVTLSSEEAHRVLLSAKLSLPKFLPLFSGICTANDSIDGMGHKFPMQKKGSDGVRCLTELLPESWEGRPEHLNRQYSGKGWKPSLDTIKEKKVKAMTILQGIQFVIDLRLQHVNVDSDSKLVITKLNSIGVDISDIGFLTRNIKQLALRLPFCQQ